MDYHQYNLLLEPRDPWADILMMELLDFGFESFQENELGLDAYIAVNEDKELCEAFLNQFAIEHNIIINCTKHFIPAKNWNLEWESNFEEIKVDDFCSIRAPFHSHSSNCKYDLVIVPKMSFGTGHHPTTFLMVKAMKNIDFTGKIVLDMGSGTGVLGILAAKLGAALVTAIDIEDWSVENAIENAQNNQVNLTVLLGGKEKIPTHLNDVILANINRNILLDQLTNYANVIFPKGKLLLSGFMPEDVELLLDKATKCGFEFLEKLQKENWICLVLEKK